MLLPYCSVKTLTCAMTYLGMVHTSVVFIIICLTHGGVYGSLGFGGCDTSVIYHKLKRVCVAYKRAAILSEANLDGISRPEGK